MSSNVVDILGGSGRIACKLPSYELRPQQLEMARAVARAFEEGEHLIVEAGTGVGKSFAYLVPAIAHVIRSGGRVVISTHTIALQEQLIHKDIPFLRSVFPERFSAVLVKGRANYLGLRRLARASARQDLLFASNNEVTELHRIEDWAYSTRDGSLSDLPQQPGATVWDRARSDGDDCLGRRCPQFQKCFYQRARQRAAEAQVLVVNHALLFADLSLRGQGASILPDFDYLVLDEAHTVEGVAGDHLGIGVSNAQVRYLL
ncbi:MAG: ATP-dependent DNA helicase, partial [Dehalococcoidia bacterium]